MITIGLTSAGVVGFFLLILFITKVVSKRISREAWAANVIRTALDEIKKIIGSTENISYDAEKQTFCLVDFEKGIVLVIFSGKLTRSFGERKFEYFFRCNESLILEEVQSMIGTRIRTASSILGVSIW